MSVQRITVTSDAAGAGKVSVDGQDISRAVRSVHIDLEAGWRPKVELELAVAFVDVLQLEHPRIVLSDDVHAALVRLGWTPPEAEVMEP